jgi:hypothetical protein
MAAVSSCGAFPRDKVLSIRRPVFHGARMLERAEHAFARNRGRKQDVFHHNRRPRAVVGPDKGF